MRFFTLLLLTVAVVLCSIYYQRSKMKHEDFEDPAATTSPTAASDDLASGTYSRRLYVIKVFDTMFGRNPTHAELERYSSAVTEKMVLDAIVKDYEKLGSPPQPDDGEPPSPAVVGQPENKEAFDSARASAAPAPPPPPSSSAEPLPPSTSAPVTSSFAGKPPVKAVVLGQLRGFVRAAQMELDKIVDLITVHGETLSAPHHS